jgi:citrate synthase
VNGKFTRTTAISDESADPIRIRGYALPDLIDRVPFDAAVYLVLTGELPTPNQRAVFSACLTAAVDHGPNAPSTDVARRVASNGTPVNAAVAAGVSAIGDYHGGAIEQAGRLFQEALGKTASAKGKARFVVEEGTRRYRRVPGFGHRVYTSNDPRVEALFAVARRHRVAADACALAQAAGAELERTTGKKLVLNIDGGMAAVLTGLGIPWRLFRGIFIIARAPGLVANVVEQAEREPPVVRSTTAIGYDGPRARKIPKSGAPGPGL